jgi:hypothetical protein
MQTRGIDVSEWVTAAPQDGSGLSAMKKVSQQYRRLLFAIAEISAKTQK